MAKCDLHVHSCYSERPSEWFLQRLGTRESYIDPEDVYRTAKKEGMDFVTITDHNTIEGAVRLKQKHPDDVIIGVESTTYFPETGTKVHVLIWGLNDRQFRSIENARSNIYTLRQLLLDENLAHAVAHPTYSINGMLSFEQIQKLFLLFDHFETNNGSRERINFEILSKAFASFTAKTIFELSDRHSIKPIGPDSWIKGQVGGSDDHSGLFTGKTYTCAEASSPEEFLARICQKQTWPQGRNNDYQSFAFAIYKIAYDFSRSRTPFTNSILEAVNSLIFDEKPIELKKLLLLNKVKLAKHAKNEPLYVLLSDLITSLQNKKNVSSEEKLALVSTAITSASDELLKSLFIKISNSLQEGNLPGLIKGLSGFLPGIFLSIPFFTSMNVLTQSRWLLDKLSQNYIKPEHRKSKRILWFTDTLLELSGVSATLLEMAQLTRTRKLDMVIVTCLPPKHERTISAPPNCIDLPCIHTYTPDFFNTYTLRLPSVLASLKLISDAAPDEIYISTPGPVGLIGSLAAKLLHVPCTAVYHTDFTRQFSQIIGDETLCRFIEDYVNWFYSQATAIAVPTQEYTTQLEQRGISPAKLRRFKRGIDPTVFAPVAASEYLRRTFGITDGITLLHSGRISKEKNLDFMAAVYEEIIKKVPSVNLIFAGDGPYFNDYREKMKKHKRVYFAGRMHRDTLPALYSASHLLVFPSITDTFGMVVLEAQSCGLPALVSDFGGPQEIILNGKTGFVAKADTIEDWTAKLNGVFDMIASYPRLYLEMRVESRQHAARTYNWDLVLQDIFGETGYNPWTDHDQELLIPCNAMGNLEKSPV
jgi:glycosyltransferase involved in cell wall biosynthesis/predicted metal-dependent phosphoesterase TrpH